MSHATTPVLVIHGGAGVIKRDMNPAREKAVRAALAQALQNGYGQLKAGKPAMDAVTAAITVLEMMQVAKISGSETFQYLEPLTIVGLLFLIVSLISAVLIRQLEKRLNVRHAH